MLIRWASSMYLLNRKDELEPPVLPWVGLIDPTDIMPLPTENLLMAPGDFE